MVLLFFSRGLHALLWNSNKAIDIFKGGIDHEKNDFY